VLGESEEHDAGVPGERLEEEQLAATLLPDRPATLIARASSGKTTKPESRGSESCSRVAPERRGKRMIMGRCPAPRA
jgi:hypothetical protein